MLIGIVGKPNVGKSTFFKAATLIDIKIANYPFVTIKANEGVGYVRTKCADIDLNVKCNPKQGSCDNGNRFVPVRILDVAGLVPGAHKGKGLGNKFLDDLRQADVLIHVIDASGSTNEEGESVTSGTYDPGKDIQFLEEEIDLWFFGILMKNWSKFIRQAESLKKPVDRALAEHFSGLKVNLDMVKGAIVDSKLSKNLRDWKEKDIQAFATQLRLKSKPIIIAASKADVPSAKGNLDSLKKRFPNYKIIPCSAESELALKEADKKEIIKYIPGNSEFGIKKGKELKLEHEKALTFIKKNVLAPFNSTGVQECLNTAVFEELRYIPIFPGGVGRLQDSEGRVLPDVFLLPPNSTALDFAFTLHTDLGEKFIRAIDVRTKKTVGKNHKLKFGDVIEVISGK